MPFGDDANDAPVGKFAQSFTLSLRMLMDPRAQTPPQFAFNHTIHRQMRTQGWHHNVCRHLQEFETGFEAEPVPKAPPVDLAFPARESTAEVTIASGGQSDPRPAPDPFGA